MEKRSSARHPGDDATLLCDDCVSARRAKRLFLAGATGVIGARLLRLMLAAGYEVAAMTRTPEKIEGLRAAGTTPVLCDILDRESLGVAVSFFLPVVVVHQVTDLPDEIDKIAKFALANARIRTVGTRNLLAAAQSVGASRFLAQSIAWPGGGVVEAHENAVLSSGGTVLRYGQYYGPGTYYEDKPPPIPRIHVDEAARRTMAFLSGPAGIFSIMEADGDVPKSTETEKQYACQDR